MQLLIRLQTKLISVDIGVLLFCYCCGIVFGLVLFGMVLFLGWYCSWDGIVFGILLGWYCCWGGIVVGICYCFVIKIIFFCISFYIILLFLFLFIFYLFINFVIFFIFCVVVC
jgi:hypothetical protein